MPGIKRRTTKKRATGRRRSKRKLIDFGEVQGSRDLAAVKARARNRGFKVTARIVGKEGRQNVHMVRIFE